MGRPRVSTRRGREGVYWRDVLGRRHFVVIPEGEKREQLLAQLESATQPTLVTVAQYAEGWLGRVTLRSTRTTHSNYERTIRLHIRGAEVGKTRLVDLTRAQLKAWAIAQLADGAAIRTLVFHCAVIRTMLEEAKDDGLIRDNPALALIRSLRLKIASKAAPQVDPETVARIVEEARGTAQYEGIALLAHLGLRISEACGLQWRDVDLDGREARIHQQLQWWGELTPLKTERSRRTVQLSQAIAEEMRTWRRRQQEAALAAGRPPTEFVLGIEPPDARRGRDRIRSCLWTASRRAGAPRMKLHALRHAFASIHLSRGADIRWVQEQLGHSQIGTTADLYGQHLRRRNETAPDDLSNLIRGGQMGLFKKK